MDAWEKSMREREARAKFLMWEHPGVSGKQKKASGTDAETRSQMVGPPETLKADVGFY